MHTLQQAIICDLDGTLALMGDRKPFDWARVGEDTPNAPVVDLLQCYSGGREISIFIVSGRSEECRLASERWLDRHGVPYEELLMRPAGDYRRDSVIKQELYDARIAGKYAVLFCLDDRQQSVDFWRSLGLTCFQVAPGAF